MHQPIVLYDMVFVQVLQGNEVEISALEKHKNELATDVEKARTELEKEKEVRAGRSIKLF